MLKFTQIEHENISDAIVRQMIDRIGRGIYKPGDKLPSERTLMKKFGVGRSSLREALRALSIMGLLDIRPGQGTFVKEISARLIIQGNILAPLVNSDIAEKLLEARLILEPEIAFLAAKRRTMSDLKELKEIWHEYNESLKKGEHAYAIGVGFHLMVARSSHNAVFVRFMESIFNILYAWGAETSWNRSFSDWQIRSHESILNAIELMDSDLAKKCMREHIEGSAYYHSVLKEHAGDDPISLIPDK